MKSLYISVWGLDGSSKSTSISTICDALEKKNITFKTTRKPGGTPFSEEIRHCVLKHWDESITSLSELMMMIASQSQAADNVVLPTLRDGNAMIEDRGWGCAYAYQVHGQNTCSDDLFFRLVNEAHQGVLPSHVLYLDIPPEKGLKRVRGRGTPDRIEAKELIHFQRFRNGYQELAKRYPNLIHTINADRELKAVQNDVKRWTDQISLYFLVLI